MRERAGAGRAASRRSVLSEREFDEGEAGAGRSRGFAPGTMIAAVLWPARNVGDFRNDLGVAGQSGNAALACVEAAWRIDRLFEIGHCGTPRSISGAKEER